MDPPAFEAQIAVPAAQDAGAPSCARIERKDTQKVLGWVGLGVGGPVVVLCIHCFVSASAVLAAALGTVLGPYLGVWCVTVGT